jgi:hypothetical protein
MQIALTFASYHFKDELSEPRSLSGICRICNIPDSHLVKRFLQEHSFLFHTWHAQHEKKLVFTYSAPRQLHNFFFDPGRSRHLYSAPLIIGKCWETVEQASTSQDSQLHRSVYGLHHFFIAKEGCQFSRASHMLSAESIRNGSDSDSLLAFLKFLSRIPWLDIWYSNHWNTIWICAIANWVCKSLVSEHVPNYNHQLTIF